VNKVAHLTGSSGLSGGEVMIYFNDFFGGRYLSLQRLVTNGQLEAKEVEVIVRALPC
jgi:hypothetical protein